MKIGQKEKELFNFGVIIININKIKKLVREECAGHSIQNNYCCEYDRTCLFFIGGERCQYFEESVLPLDPDLEGQYWSDKDNVARIKKVKPKPRITCRRCGTTVEANSNRQEYCNSCKKTTRKDQTKKAMQKIRNIG